MKIKTKIIRILLLILKSLSEFGNSDVQLIQLRGIYIIGMHTFFLLTYIIKKCLLMNP